MLDLWAIGTGIGVAIAASVLGGLALMVGAAVDTKTEARDETELDARLDEALHAPGTLAQMLALSLAAAALSGAATAALAPQAPFLNAAIVGGVGSLISLMPAPGFPSWLSWASFALTLPGTLAGAALVAAA